MPTTVNRDAPFHVPPVLDLLGGWVQRLPSFFIGLGNLESAMLADRLPALEGTRPIYIAGLARSGSTLLHEIVASCGGVCSHRIKDYPMVFTPYWWRRASARSRPTPARERPHRDKVMITSESPDAIEEMLWLAFFPKCHDPSVNNVLTSERLHPAFENFYRNHLRKLLLVENASRYVAKANYHVARIAYLRRIVPDCKFLLPVRHPVSHIGSLVRQHQWFSQGQRRNPRALAFMRRSGHFEFGLDRRPLCLDEDGRVQSVLQAWEQGDEVRGWARYWAQVYGYLTRILKSESHIARAVHAVRFEDLCTRPQITIEKLLEHCEMNDAKQAAAQFSSKIKAPDYYHPAFSAKELAQIKEETAATSREWGYD